METNTLRNNVFNQLTSTHCDRPDCKFVGNVKYDNFLHNVRIHRRCILCEQDHESKKGIMDHLAFVHHEKTNCDMCDFQVYPFERLKRHLILKHKVCSKCGERFESSMDLEHHFESVHSDKKLADSLRHSFSCDICDFVGTKRALKMHKERVHNIKTEPKAKKSAEKLPKPEKPPKSQKKPKSPKPQKLKPGPIMIPNLPIKPKKILPNLIPIRGHPPIQPKIQLQQPPQLFIKPQMFLQIQQQPQTQPTPQLQPIQPRPSQPDIELEPPRFEIKIKGGPQDEANLEQCKHCNFTCKLKNEIYIHCIRMHRHCIPCKEDFPSKTDIMNHLASFHGERVQCDICEFQDYPQENLAKHQIQEHNICKICGNRFANAHQLEEHFNYAHKKKAPEPKSHTFTCEYCEFQGSKQAVKLHQQKIHLHDYKFSCDMCDFKTYMKTKLEDHVKRRDKQSANMFYCERCEFKSCTSYGLVFHRSKIHGVTKLMKRYTCGYCWTKFTVMAHFKTHILSKHLGEEGRFSCDVCGFRTFDKCYLNKHVKKHEKTQRMSPIINQKSQLPAVGTAFTTVTLTV